MRRSALILILVPCLILAMQQKEMVKICKAYGMNEERAMAFTATLIEECTLLNINYEPLFFIAIAESGLKNILGDSGQAVGYFQLHKETCWFVQHRYGLKIPKNHTDLLKNPNLQIQIAARYFHYLLGTHGTVEEAVKHWNGSEKYVVYFNQVAEYVKRVYLGGGD